MGFDGIKPFVEDCARYGKGVFVLVKTSNPSSGQLQDMPTIRDTSSITERQRVAIGDLGLKRLSGVSGEAIVIPSFAVTAGLVDEWGADCRGDRGYSSVGAVVGATYPEEAMRLRRLMPSTYFLAPGYGAQGGGADDAAACFNDDGYGAVVSSSRAITYAYREGEAEGARREEVFDVAAGAAAAAMKENLRFALKRSGRYPW
ncbi:TPA: orotidine-5'-phosphate decarboxylase [Thermoplasmata archaeon]|nr:orotidine-5'-phosphate decarboxylase [Thermoplasmata archaeon]